VKTNPAFPGRLDVPLWRAHFVITLLLAVSISACGSGGGSVTEKQYGTGSATLSWAPPTQNLDGSPLSDLAGYKIYYGNRAGDYHTSIHIDNPGMTIYVVEYLTPNTYYFVLTAINSSGVESRFSNEVSKLVLY
jgi:hypothetical protein